MGKFQKPVSNLERVYLVYDNLCPPFANQLVLEGRQKPSKTALNKALKQSTRANPGATLFLGNTREEMIWNSGAPVPLRHVDAPDWSGADDQNSLFLQRTLDPYQGPSCEVLSVNSGDKHYLIFRSLHPVMDGLGTLYWARDFMRCLRGEKPIGHKSTMSPDELSASLTDKVRSLPQANALGPFENRDRTQPLRVDEWRRISVERPLRSSMLTKVAIAVAELAHQGRDGVVRFVIPQDLRHHRPKEKSTGNMIGYLWIEVNAESNAESLGMSLIRQLYDKSAAASLNAYQQVNTLSQGKLHLHLKQSSEMEHESGYIFSAAISNLGLIKSEDFDADKFKVQSAFFIPPFGDWGGFISLAGFDERVEATVAMPSFYCIDGQLDRIAETVRETLMDC